MDRVQNEVRQQTEQVQAAARDTAEEVRRKSAEMAQEAKDTAKELKDRTVRSAADTAHQAQEKATTYASDQKSRIAAELSNFGEAISCAAEKLREDEDESIARYAELAAEQLRSTSDYLETRSLGELMGDVENFARRRPEIFFGGMLLVGLGMARFLKASSRTQSRERRGQQRQPLAGFRQDQPAFQGAPRDESLSTGASRGQRSQNQTWPASDEPAKVGPMNDPLSYH
jgi:gas vesicle protein